MQLRKSTANDGFSKPKLFAIISIAVVAILSVPVILPHITQQYVIYHILLHVGSVIVAIFLSVVSILAYSRTGSIRILMMTFAFLSLIVVESLSLLAATGNASNPIIPGVNVEISHIFLLVMVALFGLGVLKVDR